MNYQGQIPRSRGAVSGVLLILLGLWGGLAPFVGPYFHFGFTPDKAWEYTSGRLYYSAVPAAAALLGGALILLTRNRGVGIAGGLLASLGALWLGLGVGFVTIVLKRPSISAGNPMLSDGSGGVGALTIRQYVEVIALFGGLAPLVLFFGALAVGRFSMVSAQDLTADDYSDYPASSSSGQFPTPAGQFQPPQDFPDSPSQFPGSPQPFPDTQTAPFPHAEGTS